MPTTSPHRDSHEGASSSRASPRNGRPKSEESPIDVPVAPVGERAGQVAPTLTLQLPLLRISVTGSPRAEVSTTSTPDLPRVPPLLFYGGIAVLGVAGAVEWPAAVAIAAGAWLLRTRRGSGSGTGGPVPQTTRET